jgi:hypothetical protein
MRLFCKQFWLSLRLSLSLTMMVGLPGKESLARFARRLKAIF